jgi:hypothetical protein
MIRDIGGSDGTEQDRVEALELFRAVRWHHHAVPAVIIRSPVENLDIQLEGCVSTLERLQHLKACSDDLGADAVGGYCGDLVALHETLIPSFDTKVEWRNASCSYAAHLGLAAPDQGRMIRGACVDPDRATRDERAAGRRVAGIRQLAGEADGARAAAWIGIGNGGEQGLGIGVKRLLEDRVGWCKLNDLAQIHHRDARLM